MAAVASPASATATGIEIHRLGRRDYADTLAAMRAFTDARDASTPDALWFVEHPPVFTQGQAGRAEHLLSTGDIPVVQADRGGQVTYHGPGQQVVYTLIDLVRRGYGIRSLVERIERAIVATLAADGIAAYADPHAPGVYVDIAGRRHKIASLGLRVRRGRSYHGLALNADMDLTPFSRIDPCGYAGLAMTQTRDLGGATGQPLADRLAEQLVITLGDRESASPTAADRRTPR